MVEVRLSRWPGRSGTLDSTMTIPHALLFVPDVDYWQGSGSVICTSQLGETAAVG